MTFLKRRLCLQAVVPRSGFCSTEPGRHQPGGGTQVGGSFLSFTHPSSFSFFLFPFTNVISHSLPSLPPSLPITAAALRIGLAITRSIHLYIERDIHFNDLSVDRDCQRRKGGFDDQYQSQQGPNYKANGGGFIGAQHSHQGKRDFDKKVSY